MCGVLRAPQRAENRWSYGYSVTIVKLKLQFEMTKCRQLQIRGLLYVKHDLFFVVFLFSLDCVYMCLSLCVYAYMNVMPDIRGQKRASDPLRLESQSLGTELGSCARAAHALNCWTITLSVLPYWSLSETARLVPDDAMLKQRQRPFHTTETPRIPKRVLCPVCLPNEQAQSLPISWTSSLDPAIGWAQETLPL